MNHLIIIRVYTILSLIFDRLGAFLKDPHYPAKVDEFIAVRKLIVQFELVNQWSLRVKEKYAIERYQLVVKYSYVLLDAARNPIFSCDNAPHHPDVRTYPHHKHRYPKRRFNPTEFSGRFEDFLDEVLWEITRSR